MLKALIFDFDGLILDTETPEFTTWQAIYQEYGRELPIADWGKIVGGYGISDFDAAETLSRLSQGQLDSASLRARHRFESHAVILSSSILPGVERLIRDAKQFNLKLAIASSSPHSWVDAHAQRLGIFHFFDKVICADDVAPGRTKPNPDLFLLALDQLNVRKESAVVFEDSPNGVRGARSAGIFVVAVPNPVTANMQFDHPDMKLRSLSDVSVNSLAKYFDVK